MFGNWILGLAVAVLGSSSISALPVGHRSPYAALMQSMNPAVMPVTVPEWAAHDNVLQEVALNVLEARGSDGSSPCSDLDLDDLQSLPGWPKLAKMAKDLWGDGEYDIEINPSGYNDRPATMCVSDPVLIKPTAKGNCTHARVDIPVRSGETSVEVLSGYANVGNWNITHVTSAAHALFFQGKFRTPNMTTPPSGTYMNTQLHSLDVVGEFINAPFNSFSTVASNMTRTTESLTQVQDRSCIATISQQRCVIPAGGRIQLVATGYVWFTFKTKRAPRATPHGPQHRRYSLKLEDVLPHVLDRSAWIDFSGVMNTTLRTDYFDECRWNFQL